MTTRKARGPARTYPLLTMPVGDFFFAPGRKRTTLSSYVSRQGKALGRRFITKTCRMTRDDALGWIDDDKGTLGVAVFRIF